MVRRVAVLFMLSVAGMGNAQLTEAERKGLADVLYIGNLEERDLNWERKAAPATMRLPFIDRSLDSPIATANSLLVLHAAAGPKSPSALIEQLSSTVFGDQWPRDARILPPMRDELSQVPEAWQRPVMNLAATLADVNEQIRQATSALSGAEKRTLIESLPVLAVEEPSVTFDFVRQPDSNRAKVLELAAKVDGLRLRFAAYLLESSLEKELGPLKEAGVQIPARIELKLYGQKIVLGSSGDDLHEDSDSILTIDPGGNDRYRGRHGAGIGYGAVLIDLGGDDRCEPKDASLGCGLVGIGLARFVGGNDQFFTPSLCLGAGLVGVGGFVKEGGDDLYRSKTLSQGFGMFGIGLMFDSAGVDRYEGSLFVQGAARTLGVGWIIDRTGNDIYLAGGMVLNSPLFADVHYSFAQGFGSGYREDSGGIGGGIGLLTDLAGADHYLAETYAQAASYWYSIGTTFDAAGHDTYSAHHYAQSSAMHMTSAYLFDLDGDDLYGVKFGASHAIGHDYGVAFMLDRAGNDVVVARDSTPAVGNANGLGIYIDSAGDDRYQGPPGVGNGARGSGSLGLFVDLKGQDKYREGLADGQSALRDTWAAAYDLVDPPRGGTITQDTPEAQPKPGSKPRPNDQELQELFRKATQWGVGTASAEVAAALRDLIAIGMPAFQWMVDTKLASAGRFEIRAFTAVIAALGDPARELIATKVASDHDDTAKAAMRICIEANVKQAAAHLAVALRKPPLQMLATRLAGVVQATSAVPEILPLAASPDGSLALSAAVALAQIGDAGALSTAEVLLDSSSLPIRKAALALFAKHTANAQEVGLRRVKTGDERSARIGVELLGLSSSREALDVLGSLLTDGRQGVRLQAMLALNGRCPEAFRPQFLALRNDPSPYVRSAAQRMDVGR
ncbi:MAG: hypothetical protein HONBIEJF_01600 [Fimbriimonadaceae bacterium]|nr:hypothetical protein [Fimbriimonadaceae bacterium]